jgi:hypothetical protein
MRSRDLDARLAERALRESWPVPAELRPELVRILAELARSAAASPRERTSAIKALLQASRLNLEAVKVAMAADYQDVLEELESLCDSVVSGQWSVVRRTRDRTPTGPGRLRVPRLARTDPVDSRSD